MSDSFLSSVSNKSSGFISDIFAVAGQAATALGGKVVDYLSDQWGLDSGNGIDQNLFNPGGVYSPGITSATQTLSNTGTSTQSASLVDLSVTPNSILALAVVGLVIFAVFSGR